MFEILSLDSVGLDALLSNFQYWLSRARSLLEHEALNLFKSSEQAELLSRIYTALPKITAARSLFNATAGEIGIEMSVLVSWYQLATECWHVIAEFRRSSYAT